MSETHSSEPLTPKTRLRSGTAARLAGLPVTTLRVWERRYSVVAAPKMSNGQRLYSELDVQRLSLLRRLTERGHAIGTIAALDLVALQALGNPAGPDPVSAAPARAIGRIVVIGRAVAQKLSASPACEVVAVHDDLDQAETEEDTPDAVDLLLVDLPSLQQATAQRVLALGNRRDAGSIIVLYGFGTEAAAESLRAARAIVRRNPISRRELARLAANMPWSPAEPAPARQPFGPRRYSDEALFAIADRPSAIQCECLRHVAEIVMQLASFERYSADCSSSNSADAALHRHLSDTAGAARSMFEQALEKMLDEQGPMPGMRKWIRRKAPSAST